MKDPTVTLPTFLDAVGNATHTRAARPPTQIVLAEMIPSHFPGGEWKSEKSVFEQNVTSTSTARPGATFGTILC